MMLSEVAEGNKGLYMFEVYEKDRIVGGSEQGFDLLDALLLKIDFEDLGYYVRIYKSS